MAQSIGQVTRKGDRYTGFLKTALVRGSLEIFPNLSKDPESRQPDFRIRFDDQEAGAGWFAEEKEGMDYTSINCRIDDPSFPAPLQFSTGRAAGQEDADLFSLIWNRRSDG